MAKAKEQTKVADKSWTPYRIAKIRKAINKAFDAVVASIRGLAPDEIEKVALRNDEERAEVLELVREFAAMVKVGTKVPGK